MGGTTVSLLGGGGGGVSVVLGVDTGVLCGLGGGGGGGVNLICKAPRKAVLDGLCKSTGGLGFGGGGGGTDADGVLVAGGGAVGSGGGVLPINLVFPGFLQIGSAISVRKFVLCYLIFFRKSK
jgi:hypothetical protein